MVVETCYRREFITLSSISLKINSYITMLVNLCNLIQLINIWDCKELANQIRFYLTFGQWNPLKEVSQLAYTSLIIARREREQLVELFKKKLYCSISHKVIFCNINESQRHMMFSLKYNKHAIKSQPSSQLGKEIGWKQCSRLQKSNNFYRL